MNYGKILAWIIIILEFGASIGYGLIRDWRRCAYWFFAACLTIAVTV